MLNRIESGGLHVDRHDVALGELVRHTRRGAGPARPPRRGVDVEVRDCGPGVVVAGDAGQLRAGIINLGSNAIKFTPAGGRVEVSLEVVPTGADGEGPRYVRDATPGSASPSRTCRSCSPASSGPATRPAPPSRAPGSAWPSCETIVEGHGGQPRHVVGARGRAPRA